MEPKSKKEWPRRRRHPKGGTSRARLSLQEPEEWKPRFLKVFCQFGFLRPAAKAVGVSYATVYRHLKKDPDFASEFREAVQEMQELVELEARRRALEGDEVPVMRKIKGQVVEIGRVRRYSDMLLCLLLKKGRPEIFGNI